VEDVAPGSSAEAAGLRRGDIITRIQNRPVSNAGTVAATIGIAEPGTTVEVVYLRDGREGRSALRVDPGSERTVVVGAEAALARGATLRSTTEGLQVVAVEGGSPAAQAGLQAGDILEQIDGVAVSGLADLNALEPAGERRLSVRRDGEGIEVVLP